MWGDQDFGQSGPALTVVPCGSDAPDHLRLCVRVSRWLQFQCLYGHVPANPSASFLREVTVTGSSDDGRRWTLYFKDEDGPATDQPSEMTVSTPTDAFNTATYVWFPGIMPERYPGGVTWTTDFLGIDIVNAQLDQFDKGSDGLFVSGTVTCP